MTTVDKVDKEDSSELSEVLITDIFFHWLKQHSSYANFESFGPFPNEKAPLVLFCFTVRDQSLPKKPLTLRLDEGTSHLFTCKGMEMHLQWSLEWMPALHCTAAIWRLHSPWHLLLAASFCLQLELKSLVCSHTNGCKYVWKIPFLCLIYYQRYTALIHNKDFLYLHPLNLLPVSCM